MSKKIFDEYVIIPGDTILELLETNSMTQLDLAYKTGINKKTINEIVKGKAPITVATALKLEYVFGVNASFWCNLESSYREKLERKKDFDSIIAEEKYLNNIPYLEMSKRNWDFIEPTKDSYEKVINLRKFFAVASLKFDTELKRKLAFRKNDNKNFSFESLYCFLRYGEIQSNKEEYNKFDLEKLKIASLEIRKLASNSFLSQFDKIRKILSECGVALIYEANLPHTYINGVSYKITPDKAIIMISNKGKKDDILWFTFFHEIAHLIKHSKKEVFIDSDDNMKSSIEDEADDYSRNMLIPDDEYDLFVKSTKKYTSNLICNFAKKNNILPGIVVGRLQKDGIIKWNQFSDLIIRI